MDATNASKERTVRRLRLAGQSVISGKNTPEVSSREESRARAFHRRVSAPEFLGNCEDVSPLAELTEASSRLLPFEGDAPTMKWHLSLCNERLLNAPDLKSGLSGCFSLRFSPDESELAAGFFDGSVCIYDVSDGSEVSKWNVAKSREGKETSMSGGVGITNLRWYPSSHRAIVATVDTSGATRIWGDSGKFPRSGEFQRLLEIPGEASLTAVSFSYDGSYLLVGGSERVIHIYDVASGRAGFKLDFRSTVGNDTAAPGRISRHSLKVRCLSSHPDNKDIFLSGGLDQHVLIWDLRTGVDAVGVVSGTQLSGDAMEISHDGNTLFAGSHRPHSPLQLYDLRTCNLIANWGWWGGAESTVASPASSKLLQRRPSLDTAYASTSCSVFAASWDSDANRILVAAGEHENQARVFQRVSHSHKPLKVVGTLDGENGGFWSAAVTSDGRTVAFGDGSGAVYLIDVAGAMF